MRYRANTAADRLILAGAIVAACLMVAPVIWGLGLSLKSNEALFRDTSSVLDGPYTLRNYWEILVDSSVTRWLLNSTVVAAGMTLGVLLLSSLAGYGFARLEFPGRRIAFGLVLFGLAVPEQAVIITRHQLFSEWHLHNTYAGLILPGLTSSFGVLLMTQYFKAIPRELDEAALLDNASRFRIFWRVLLPMTLPAQATLGIFTFLGTWNDYWWPLISSTNEQMYTLTTGIASMQRNFAESAGIGFLTAQAIFAALPIVLVYIFFQKYIVGTVAREKA
jgi:multiple sugar transport system permease protein